MFCVPTYVAASPRHGVGVFTPSPIPAGTILWKFTEDVDLVLDADLLASVPEPLQSRLRRYCYREDERRYVLCGDNARFMNHSFEPNCDDVEGPYTVALRDIEADEELTCDYRSFDLDSRLDGLESWREEAPSGGTVLALQRGEIP